MRDAAESSSVGLGGLSDLDLRTSDLFTSTVDDRALPACDITARIQSLEYTPMSIATIALHIRRAI